MDVSSHNQDLPKKLPNYERTAACFLIIAILFVMGLNFYLDEGTIPEPSQEPHYVVSPYIEVTVKGAVAKPGVFQVTKGTLVEEVIQMAEPLETANLKTIKLDSKITRRRTINIKLKSARQQAKDKRENNQI